ncbi:MAG: ATP-binding protein, partial [Candidatus Aenigmatarchaeota archaeon]
LFCLNEAILRLDCGLELIVEEKSQEKFYLAEVLDKLKEIFKMHPVEYDLGNIDNIIIKGRKLSLTSALYNLITNALQNSTEPINVSIRVDRENKKIIITIRNSGSIPLKLLSMHKGRRLIFSLNVTTRKGGTGLGTTESWYVIKDLGGTIDYANITLEGKDFVECRIELPYIEKSISSSSLKDRIISWEEALKSKEELKKVIKRNKGRVSFYIHPGGDYVSDPEIKKLYLENLRKALAKEKSVVFLLGANLDSLGNINIKATIVNILSPANYPIPLVGLRFSFIEIKSWEAAWEKVIDFMKKLGVTKISPFGGELITFDREGNINIGLEDKIGCVGCALYFLKRHFLIEVYPALCGFNQAVDLRKLNNVVIFDKKGFIREKVLKLDRDKKIKIIQEAILQLNQEAKVPTIAEVSKKSGLTKQQIYRTKRPCLESLGVVFLDNRALRFKERIKKTKRLRIEDS